MCLGIQACASTKRYGTAQRKLGDSKQIRSKAVGMGCKVLSHVSRSKDFIPVDF